MAAIIAAYKMLFGMAHSCAVERGELALASAPPVRLRLRHVLSNASWKIWRDMFEFLIDAHYLRPA
jgi:hypothetical protein